MNPKLATNTRVFVGAAETETAKDTAVSQAYELAKAAYGPASGNVGIEKVFGDPIASHDGIFNLDHFHVADPNVDIPLRSLIQASRQTNVRAGDGTTAAVILAVAEYREAKKLLTNKTETRFSIMRKLRETAARISAIVDEQRIEATPEMLEHVAVISASDPELGALISDTIQEIGPLGGVVIEDFRGVGMYNDVVNGFYFRGGFTNAALAKDPSSLESKFETVAVFVCDRVLDSVHDIAPILNACLGQGIHELVLVGTVKGDALAQAIKSRLEGKIITTIVEPPEHSAMRVLFMDDLALYTGATVMNAGANPNDFQVSMLGEARAVVNEFSTTFLNGDGQGSERLKERVAQLGADLKVASSPIEQEALRKRLGRLTGKIAILRVGGRDEIEQQERKFRVEDAVAALQAAMKEGIVPGGGTLLARLPEDLPFREAFDQPLLALVQNAYNDSIAAQALADIKKSKAGHGFDLRAPELKLTDLKKAGVMDPALVIKEVVGNAASAAANLIGMTVLLPFDNREAKRG